MNAAADFEPAALIEAEARPAARLLNSAIVTQLLNLDVVLYLVGVLKLNAVADRNHNFLAVERLVVLQNSMMLSRQGGKKATNGKTAKRENKESHDTDAVLRGHRVTETANGQSSSERNTRN
nr:hypothetical protein [Denitrobaculum tricleocarpae]